MPLAESVYARSSVGLENLALGVRAARNFGLPGSERCDGVGQGRGRECDEEREAGGEEAHCCVGGDSDTAWVMFRLVVERVKLRGMYA